MADHMLAVRQAVVARLRADATLTALVPAARICGEEVPANLVWPFIRYGLPAETRYEQSCGEGSDQSVDLHVFARGPGMDKCTAICAAVRDVLAADALAVEPLGLMALDYMGGRVLMDGGEAGAYHGVLQYEITTIGD